MKRSHASEDANSMLDACVVRAAQRAAATGSRADAHRCDQLDRPS